MSGDFCSSQSCWVRRRQTRWQGLPLVSTHRRQLPAAQEEVAEEAPVPDLLGSILSGQSLLMMSSADVVIHRDGSLSAKRAGEGPLPWRPWQWSPTLPAQTCHPILRLCSGWRESIAVPEAQM